MVVPTLYIDGDQFTGFSNNRTRIIRTLGIDPPNAQTSTAHIPDAQQT